VAGDAISEENVFKNRSGPDVVKDEGSPVAGNISDDPYVGGRYCPYNDVSGCVIAGNLRYRNRRILTLEEHSQIGNAPVIDVRVRARKAPVPWILLERCPHVLVHEALEVDAGVPVGPNDDVGAGAAVDGQVTPRVCNSAIRAVIDHHAPNLVTRTLYDEVSYGGTR
jgi:hypothetical protein